MRSRALRIAILLFQALWLNVIVPGHKRGAIGLPGEKCPTCAAEVEQSAVPPCCALKGHSTPDHQPPGHGDPAEHCAVCYFAARLSVPVVLDFTLPPLGLVGLCQTAEPQIAPRVFFVATYQGRAPPGHLFTLA